MNNFLYDIKNSLSHLFFPHNCLVCATDVIDKNHLICTRCLVELPQTNFSNAILNPVEKTFVGRLKIEEATALFYFNKHSALQKLIKQLKYKNNIEVGIFLGELLGSNLIESKRFSNIDFLIPLPLNKKKLHIRGYNQAEVICRGIQKSFNKPIVNNVSIRKVFTQTQTQKSRIDRWQNMEGVFSVENPQKLENKHILLVDDVITTGATIESCGQVLSSIHGIKISVAAIAFTA